MNLWIEPVFHLLIIPFGLCSNRDNPKLCSIEVKSLRHVLLPLLIFWLVFSGTAGARPLLFFDRPQLGMKLRYKLEEEKRSSALGESKDTSREFKERLTVQTRGWIYHPALCKLTLRFEPEWTQGTESFDSEADQKYSSYLPAYFMDATFLETKPYTLYLYGQQNQTSVNSVFARQTETRTDSYGGSLRFKSPKLPVDLSYSHLESEQTGFYTSEEKGDDWRLIMAQRGEATTTRLSSAYTDKERVDRGFATHTLTSDSEIRNYVDFGTRKQLRLESTAAYRWTESDVYETSHLRFNEHLDWKHSPTLKSAYYMNYSQIESNGFDSRSSTANGQVTHHLYDNLTTTVGLWAEGNDYGTGKEDIGGARLDMRYLREIPWGTLTVDLGQSYEATYRDYDRQQVQVVNEQQVLSSGAVTLLEHENVDLDSVEVTDATGTVIYIRDIDYTLTPINTFVRISRVSFGAIADGQTVLVRYRYTLSSDYDDGVYDQSYGVALNLWSALFLSYRYQHADQRIFSGTPPEHPIDDTIESADGRLDFGWSDTHFSYTDTQKRSGVSTLVWRAEETLRFRPTRRLFFSLGGYTGRTRFKDENETEENYGGKASLYWLPAPWCRFNFVGFQDNVMGTTQETISTGVSAELEMAYRIWGVKFIGEYIDEEQRIEANERTRFTLSVLITRELW